MWKLSIVLFLLTTHSISQTKQELIDSIIKVNIVESDCIGYGCMPSKQYNNFQTLKSLLSEQELNTLSKHENPTLRTYALNELVQSGKGDLVQLLAQELRKNERVRTFEGCLMDFDPISSILYHEYWNKIRIEARNKARDGLYEEEQAMKRALETDVMMERLDSVVIHNRHVAYWLLYRRVFKNRKHKESYLSRIEDLAFKQNNSYAFEYLRKNYSSRYDERMEKYFTIDFPRARFKTESEIIYLNSLIETLLESERKDYRDIVIAKLKQDDSWRKHSGWIKNTLKNYGINEL
ncbi:hypothetical protein POV27_05805 [Aureisphaera galaxeae]|uniref:hypothetical protein n=1 Tax=Aureisphaera galaxeae TaxID=1538023 RepID=UPI002350A77A|nr:hypothetical protein [Aureisphaera galaxeae]MDC8003556.1 hypothetical protein [Aureisphaera galaxeae]